VRFGGLAGGLDRPFSKRRRAVGADVVDEAAAFDKPSEHRRQR
jgi:hypothetical protein